MQYGIVYQGSKNKIAKNIIDILPAGTRFVDLFGGGFAMSHCALLSGKYKKVYYNEINPLLVKLIQNAINGEYKNETRWLSCEDFNTLKEVDGYVKYCWSFGTNGNTYLYSKEIEPWKKALHYARVLNDFSLFEEFGIKTDGTRADIKANHALYKEKYIIWYLKNILKENPDILKLKEKLENKIKINKEELRLYLCDALQKSGLTAAEVNRRLNTQMSGHYFGRSQWSFPTREYYNKMREFMPLKPYDEVYGYQDLLQSLERLQSLQSLERLQRLQSLERLSINCGSYLEYKYQPGDVVYCDPPYENTAGYNNTNFNHKEFYEWVKNADFPVYFSSYPIKEDFKAVFETEKNQTFSAINNSKKMLEVVYWNGKGKHNVITLINNQLRLEGLYA